MLHLDVCIIEGMPDMRLPNMPASWTRRRAHQSRRLHIGGWHGRLMLPLLLIIAATGLVAALPTLFRYVRPAAAAAPTVTAVSPNAGRPTGGNTVQISGTNLYGGILFKTIAIGTMHSCGIATNDRLYCWGANHYGQLGSGQTAGDTNPITTPSPVIDPIGTRAVADIQVGYYHSCATMADNGQVYCWGGNGNGQVGTGTNSSAVATPTSPVGSIGTNAVSKVGMGVNHTCVIVASNSQLYCWGANANGQVGTGTAGSPNTVPSPTSPFDPIGTNAVSNVAGGWKSTCAILTSNSQLYCWGSNEFGQLGNGSTDTTINTPTPALTADPVGANAVKSVALGFAHACALLASNSQMYCWGHNIYGQMGQGATNTPGANVFTPIQPMSPIGTNAVSSIAGANGTTCAVVTSNQQLYCWGYNSSGQLGTGSISPSVIPAPTQPANPIGAASITTMRMGHRSVCVNKSGDSALYCWGMNDYGQQGNGTTSAGVSTPAPSVGQFPTVQFGSTAATNVTYASPTQINVTAPAGTVDTTVSVTATNVDGTHTLANAYTYQDPPTITAISPVRGPTGGGTSVTLTGTGFRSGETLDQFAYGGTHTCGITTASKRLYCWGDNTYGQLGIGTQGNSYRTPMPVANPIGAQPVAEVTANYRSTCARLVQDNKLYCWGDNAYGQLGDSSIPNSTRQTTPVPVAGVFATTGAGRLSSFGTHVCATRATDNTLYCWGENIRGEIGIGSNSAYVATPAAVTGALTGVAIGELASGFYHTCATVASSGTLYCWGSNQYGQVGSGSVGGPTSIPVAVTGAFSTSSARSITAGDHHTCAIATTNNQAYCWGRNNQGQLGNNKSTDSSPDWLSATPTTVNSPVGSAAVAQVVTGGVLWLCAHGSRQSHVLLGFHPRDDGDQHTCRHDRFDYRR